MRSSEPEGQRSPGKSQGPIGKKPTVFSCKVSELLFSCVGVPVGDNLFRAAIRSDGGGSREEKGGMPGGKDFQRVGGSSVGSQPSRITSTLSLVQGFAG